MIRRVIDGVSVVETIKPVIAGDDGVVYGRYFLPCHCTREGLNMGASDKSERAFAASAVEPVSRLDPDGLQSLALRCEQADAGALMLDNEIWWATARNGNIDYYSQSIDAAMTLVPNSDHFPTLSKNFNGTWSGRCYQQWSGEHNAAQAATPALAMCASALKAHAAIATEARRAETAQTGSVHEGAAIAQNISGGSHG